MRKNWNPWDFASSGPTSCACPPAGRWPAGALMPSEAELVAEFGVSRMTVNRALRELQSEGLVDRTQGVGTFAAQLHKVSSTLTIHDLHEEIVDRGHQHHAAVHVQRAEPATTGLAEQLGVKPGDEVFHTLILHTENGVPLQCEDRYVNPATTPAYLQIEARVTGTNITLSAPNGGIGCLTPSPAVVLRQPGARRH